MQKLEMSGQTKSRCPLPGDLLKLDNALVHDARRPQLLIKCSPEKHPLSTIVQILNFKTPVSKNTHGFKINSIPRLCLAVIVLSEIVSTERKLLPVGIGYGLMMLVI